ncbi:MAG: Na+-dependent transporter [Rhizobiales bacterium]|nr:Na+-dependent transporter [Hyphomicrobiales bacterium]
MIFLDALAAALAWLGRQGTRALAAMVFIGIALPPLGALLKPFVTEAVFALLVLAFLLVEPAALRVHVARPALVIIVAFWTMVALPAMLGWGYLWLGVDQRSPDLFLALVLQAAASPLMSSPAIAALLGLDAALVLFGLIACTSVVSLTAPLFARQLVGETLTLSPLALGLKLFLMLVGAALLAAAIRKFAGHARITRQRERIDGLNVIVLFVFIAALMGDIAVTIYAEPMLVGALILLSFVLTLGPLALTVFVFARAGLRQAFALGLMASQRNMGLMLAAAGGAVPDLTWLYFALAQFPIYLLPQMLKPLARVVNGGRTGA